MHSVSEAMCAPSTLFNPPLPLPLLRFSADSNSSCTGQECCAQVVNSFADMSENMVSCTVEHVARCLVRHLAGFFHTAVYATPTTLRHGTVASYTCSI